MLRLEFMDRILEEEDTVHTHTHTHTGRDGGGERERERNTENPQIFKGISLSL